MLHRAFFALTLLVSSADCVQKVAADVLDFDNLSAGMLVTMPISGVTFTLTDNTAPSIFNGASSSPPNSLLNASSFSFSTPPADLVLTFGAPVNDVSFDYTFENGDITFKIFQGATLSTVTRFYDSNSLNIETADFSSFKGVTSLTMSSSYYQDFIAIDHLVFTPVPEPASGFILVLGITTLVHYVRRRRVARTDT